MDVRADVERDAVVVRCPTAIVSGTANVSGLLVPCVDVTVRSRGPDAAFEAIVIVAVARLGLITVTLPTTTPLPASIVIPERKRNPLSVTFTVVPGEPKFGVTVVIVGVLIDSV